MLRGERVGLRARHDVDLPILLKELYDDVSTRSRADSRPWVPVSPDDPKKSPFDVSGTRDNLAIFSVVDLQTDELVGDALLWQIDLHNRMAHIGISIRPASRGRGLSAEVIRVLCHYGFVIRGLNRLQIETLADNLPMRRAASTVGFSHEGTLRNSAWVTGQFLDEVIYGLLAAEWLAAQPPLS